MCERKILAISKSRRGYREKTKTLFSISVSKGHNIQSIAAKEEVVQISISIFAPSIFAFQIAN